MARTSTPGASSQPAIAARSGASFEARTIALIGPTAAGVIDSRSIPSADQRHRLQRPPAHLAAHRRAARPPPRHGATTRRRKRRIAGLTASRSARRAWGWRGRRRTGTASGRWCRSTGSRSWAAAGRAVRPAPAPRASRRSGSASAAACPRAARSRALRLEQRCAPRRTPTARTTIGNMTLSVRPAAASSSARACDLHQPAAFEREAQRAPAHRRILLVLVVVVEIGQRLVAADIDGAEHHRLVARRVEHVLVEPLLALALRQRRRDEELEFGAEQPDPVGAGHVERGDIVAQPGIDHHRDAVRRPWSPAAGRAARRIRRGASGAARARPRTPPPSPSMGRTKTAPRRASSSSRSPSAICRRTSRDAAEHRHAHRARDDRDVRGQRAFLEHHALQPPPVIFEQFGRAEVARDQDRVLPQPHLRRGAHLARDDPQQPVRQILEIVHPVGEQRIVDLAHPHRACAAGRARSPPRRSGRCRSPR